MTRGNGIAIAEIVVGDEPDSWRRAGFTVDGDTCQIGEVAVHLVGRDGGKRIRSWAFRGVSDEARTSIESTNPPSIDGLPTRVIDGEAAAAVEHPNGVLIIDHIVVLTPDVPRTTAAIEAIGLPALRVRETDQYGAPFTQTFFRAGEVIIELIGPAEPGEGDTGFFGLAYTVADLDALRDRYGDDGLGEIKDAVQPGRRIATLRHKVFDISVATAFMSGGAAADGVDGVDGTA